ncbi:cation:proton antiporter [Phototrophicus methaneseepsis]|uniref:Cation:proton antiporter n=1 Tax=Phototrophicus methaneseepsis TaxID=2710758 RepID=A0A7S8IE34_9CHLR|nr:monovalent cation:proton antiporter family protein [Phototrophicus methaneseepsis]QPC82186.1 cation:proton antiporter [Phototrophicus methaneseepsis]
MEVPSIVIYSLSFLLIALAAKQIGKFFSRYELPYITGYLLAGALAGPFILGMLPSEASEELRYIDDIALAVIAFIAGSELYLRELKDRLNAILLNAAGIVIAAFLMLGIAIFFLQSVIPFAADFSTMTRAAVALLGATILLALSPASTIAVIQEVRAKGPFSKTVLSIAVVMDVVIIVLFAVSVAFARAMIDNLVVDVSFAILLIADIAIALVSGYLVGRVIGLVMSLSASNVIKALLLLVIGFIIFELGYSVPEWSYETFGFKIKIEPLLIAMVAGFTVTNFTRYRQPFEDLLHEISPYVYVAFFALTGVGLKLDILFSTLGIALVLFLVRMAAILVGTYAGGTIANESPTFRRWAWMGLITQAGIALGLARETAVAFPATLGGDFSTLIIAVVVLNEVFGPLFLKYVLRRVGEAHVPGDGAGRSVVILGVEQGSMALARQLTADGWHVVVADTNAEHVERLAAEDVDERHIKQVDSPTLKSLFGGSPDTLVAMLEDDEANLRACELAAEDFGVRSMVARVQDIVLRERFESLGVHVLDPASAMVNLLHQYVRAPEAVELLLRQHPDHEVTQITIYDRAIDGLRLRDLRLPNDVLILEIIRDGISIVPDGLSILRVRDDVTLLGSPDSLTEVSLKLGY